MPCLFRLLWPPPSIYSDSDIIYCIYCIYYIYCIYCIYCIKLLRGGARAYDITQRTPINSR